MANLTNSSGLQRYFLSKWTVSKCIGNFNVRGQMGIVFVICLFFHLELDSRLSFQELLSTGSETPNDLSPNALKLTVEINKFVVVAGHQAAQGLADNHKAGLGCRQNLVGASMG